MAAELHGLISSLLCGGSRDASWLALIHDLTNDGVAFPQSLSPASHYSNCTKQRIKC